MADIVKHERHEISRADFDAQIALLAKFKLPPTAIERQYVRVDKADDGSPRYVLCKRENPIKIFEIDDDNNRVIAGMTSYSERINFSKKRGKYNDEHRLGDQGNVRVGEVEAWASI